MEVFLVGLSAMVLIFLTQTSVGWTADRSLKAITIQPLIALTWCVGTYGVANKGLWAIVSYTTGSTIGCCIALILRRRAYDKVRRSI